VVGAKDQWQPAREEMGRRKVEMDMKERKEKGQ
jgi:hypothetical protein